MHVHTSRTKIKNNTTIDVVSVQDVIYPVTILAQFNQLVALSLLILLNTIASKSQPPARDHVSISRISSTCSIWCSHVPVSESQEWTVDAH